MSVAGEDEGCVRVRVRVVGGGGGRIQPKRVPGRIVPVYLDSEGHQVDPESSAAEGVEPEVGRRESEKG